MNNSQPDNGRGPSDDIEKTLGLNAGANGKRIVKRVFMAGIILLAVAAAAYKFLGPENGTHMEYTTQPAETGSLTITVTATGNLEPINQVDVGSELSGIIESVLADYNERVTEGQVLAVLDTSKLNAQVVKSRAALASAKAKVLETDATIKEAKKRPKPPDFRATARRGQGGFRTGSGRGNGRPCPG